MPPIAREPFGIFVLVLCGQPEQKYAGRTAALKAADAWSALTAAIWHNETTGRDGPARSLTAYDH